MITTYGGYEGNLTMLDALEALDDMFVHARPRTLQQSAVIEPV